jgi:hypothetical protein
MRNNVIVFILTVFSALVFSETINFDINDYTFSADSLTVSYKEKTYRNIAPFGRTLPAVFQEYRFESSYSEAVVINSYDSVLVDPDLGIEYFNGNTLVFGKKFPRKPINIGARGIKRHGGFSVIEKNPFFIYNDSLFFVTSVNFDFTGRKNIETDLVKNQSYTKIDLIIITPEEFAPSFEVYKSFKTKQGSIAEITTTEDIYAEYPGESDVIKIRNFIKDKYVQNDLEYVIIGGGYKTVPVGKALPYVSAYTGEIYTDSFYSKLDGEIDANGNGIYFEYNDYADPYEDVYVGRFPGNTAEEISAIINKTISYYSADRGYRVGFNPSVFLLGMDVFNTGDGRKWCNNVKTEFSESFTIDSLYEGVSSGFSRTGIFEKLNAGYNFVYSQSHGIIM